MGQIVLLNGPRGVGKNAAKQNMLRNSGWLALTPDVWPLVEGTEGVFVSVCETFADFIKACTIFGAKNVLLMRIARPHFKFGPYDGEPIDDMQAVFGNTSMTIVNDLDEAYFLSETKHFANAFVARARRKEA